MADLSQPVRRDLARQGKAMPSGDGGRFPIRNRTDLQKAVHAVGRVRPNTEEARSKVRRFITRRARELGLTNLLPDTWNPDGTLKS
jgi:hypothetical protein